jgi:hypothetical protein
LAAPCSDALAAKDGDARIDVGSEFVENDNIEVPVFSDVHGNLEGLFRAIGDLQVRRKRRFPVILVTGDFGFFPTLAGLNDEQRAHELKNDAAYSLPAYYADDRLYQEYFVHNRDLRRLAGQVYFLRGNHEDQTRLRELTADRTRKIVSVDKHGVLKFLTDGAIVGLSWPGSSVVRVAAFGGIHPQSRPKATARDPLIAFDNEALDLLLTDAGQLQSQGQAIDLLLTHQSGDAMPSGHSDIDALRELLRPRYHFSGHGHRFAVSSSESDGSVSYQIKNLGAQPRPARRTGSAVILKIHKSGQIGVIEGI